MEIRSSAFRPEESRFGNRIAGVKVIFTMAIEDGKLSSMFSASTLNEFVDIKVNLKNALDDIEKAIQIEMEDDSEVLKNRTLQNQ